MFQKFEEELPTSTTSLPSLPTSTTSLPSTTNPEISVVTVPEHVRSVVEEVVGHQDFQLWGIVIGLGVLFVLVLAGGSFLFWKFGRR